MVGKNGKPHTSNDFDRDEGAWVRAGRAASPSARQHNIGIAIAGWPNARNHADVDRQARLFAGIRDQPHHLAFQFLPRTLDVLDQLTGGFGQGVRTDYGEGKRTWL